ncbi:Uncharacterised protein [Mycobacteroides abscessus subsp. abscessus]|nr:Uncharacterised protein [Mycobacteroides abscessus subsp. abscessus]
MEAAPNNNADRSLFCDWSSRSCCWSLSSCFLSLDGAFGSF